MNKNLKDLMKTEKRNGAKITDKCEKCFISCRGKLFKEYAVFTDYDIFYFKDYEQAMTKALIIG